ncbi:MAG: pyruvate, phosphate dikinase [Spirochaetes bacterium]|uniref:Pyruvate, phosphate dikinase n=1 Tax=Candidatus Ornithospirochaeta stercoripullorum TaxID=2840899 RepID=A0A9D9E4P0_9SPIO|nr:pyruvate, phosphate dikinase [Candidatus Ornithospirochaeta stercoripullorum]
MYLLDQTWLPFANLMLRHVYSVLLICSDYDRFMLEEDGRVEEELYKEYTQLGLSSPPKISHASNEESALQMIDTQPFDLVISMLDLGSDRVEGLAKAIKIRKPYMPVIALSPSPDHRKARELRGENCPYIDYLFYWQGNTSLFLAMVKLIEDRMNVKHDTDEADVQVIILVEDSVRFISSYLPEMYMCLIKQNRLSILEALNDWGKTLRMRGRPKILLATDYDEAWGLYTEYRANILGVITDINFPSSEGTEGSGLTLAKAVMQDNPEVPVLIQSTEIENEADAKELGAAFLWKLSPTLLEELGQYFLQYYNFGPFIFINPATGEEIARANTMKEVQETLKELPLDSFRYHSKRNDFSRWLRAQSLYMLAKRIKNINLDTGMSDKEVRDMLYTTIKEYRSERTRGVIAEFSPSSYDDTVLFARIGKGSLGGKGRGLAFIAMEMKANGIRAKYPSIYLSIPRTIVITTEFFDEFMEENGFSCQDFQEAEDSEILKVFLSGKMPERLVTDLKAILAIVRKPLSIRSSSLLEDSHFQPFAGVYQTSMIANCGDDDKRLEELSKSIKTVWASTYFSTAREYLKSTLHSPEEEKMAVIIQQVTGARHGDYWYPNISGVARSLNYYPVPGQKAEDGVGMLSFGLGKTIVDEGTALRFCPAKPRMPSDSLTGESSVQDRFYALSMTGSFSPEKNSDNLVQLSIENEVGKFPNAFKGIVSTLDMATGLISESTRAEGIKMLTFNGVLKYETLPLAKVIDEMLKLGTAAMAEPVEIEFAVNTEHENRPDFSILQIRPISGISGYTDIPISQDDIDSALIYAEKVMGNGIIEDIKEIITIKPEAFDRSHMVEMARELEVLNREAEGGYVLITAGRLGSSDRWLGIPCTWSQISKAHVIIETGLKELQVEPSQGTHFFQNMTSLGCIYLTINPMYNDGFFRFDKIKELNIVKETEHFLAVRTETPLIVKASGLESKAIIRTT